MYKYSYTLLTSNTEAVLKSNSVKRAVIVSLTFALTCYLVVNLLGKANSSLVLIEDDEPLKPGEIEFELEHCGCKRTLLAKHDIPAGLQLNQTTCGIDAFRRGMGQRIVGFSFYGDINSDYSKKKGYFEGIVGNLKLMPKYYPGWVMRLYYDLDKSDPVLKDLCALACSDTNLDICDAKHLPGTPFVDASKVFAMNWRFFPTLDPQVDVLLSRDLDSRLSQREVTAVDEWMKGKKRKAIHAMRDNPSHGVGLLGASWGTDLTKDNARNRWKKSWQKILSDKEAFADRHRIGPDQEMLKKYVWNPWGKFSSVQHDSYLCKYFPGSIGFPTQRKMEPNNYVASVWKDGEMIEKRCPKECRRHPEWIYC